MVKTKRSRPRDPANAEWIPTTRSGKPLASETPVVMHTPGLHKKKKRPLSGKKRMKNFRKRISEGEASPEVVERQKEIARKSYESKKAKRAKEKTEYQEAIAKRDSLLLELDETKQKLADAEFKCEGLMSVN